LAQLKSTNILGNLSVTGIIKGNLEGNALKDSAGNVIKDTYLKLTGGTLSNTLTIAKPSMDVEVSGYGTEALVIGANGVSGLHLALDDNEIMAKSGPTSSGTLFLNADSANKAGGRVEIGSGGLLSKGAMTITSSSGGNTEFIFDRNTNANWKLFSSNGEFYIQCDYTSGKTSYYNVV